MNLTRAVIFSLPATRQYNYEVKIPYERMSWRVPYVRGARNYWRNCLIAILAVTIIKYISKAGHNWKRFETK